jgi:hypothetical protein
MTSNLLHQLHDLVSSVMRICTINLYVLNHPVMEAHIKNLCYLYISTSTSFVSLVAARWGGKG